LVRKANWSEWVYCGVGSDTKEDVINKAVDEYFQDSIIYCVSNRRESSEVNKQNVLERIKELEQNNIFLCDANFKKVIWFDKIGVMRFGIVPTHL